MDIGLSPDELVERLFACLDANKMTDGVHVRLMVTRGVKATPYQDPRATISPATVVIIPEWKTPKPEAVAKGVVRLADFRRFDVPVVLVCPEFTPAQAREWIDAGELPELAKATHLELVDIDSGHWPMFTRPVELAQLLAAAAAEAEATRR